MGNRARDSLFALAEIIQHLPTMREKVKYSMCGVKSHVVHAEIKNLTPDN